MEPSQNVTCPEGRSGSSGEGKLPQSSGTSCRELNQTTAFYQEFSDKTIINLLNKQKEKKETLQMKSQDVLSDVPEFSFLYLPLAGFVTLDTFLNYSELRCHLLQNGANDSHLQGLFRCLSDIEPCLTYNQCPENGSYYFYFNYTSSF